MPGTNLTREEAHARAELLAVDSYSVELDLSTAPDGGVPTFGSTTVIRFTCREPGASTFADLVGATVHEVVLNGRSLEPDEIYVDSRLRLEGLESDNELRVVADCAYSRSGEGLHRFRDPADGRVYTYTQLEVPDARRVYTTFEQPDLKASFTFTVTAPEGWVVLSNSPAPEPTPAGEGLATWAFAPTEPLATYFTAIVAGEYHAVHDTHASPHGEIQLGHYCRQSVARHLDVEELLTITRQGFTFFEEAFGFPYPFGRGGAQGEAVRSYDQVYVPEYNMGAMENAGCITYRDEYLPRSRQTRAFYEQRANTILHEMAHMWFGDLVTMKWWDDLWLNESFAEWAYRQDQLPSTHPVAADNHDLEAVEVNFDGITYAKGASTLKQLVAWVGEEEFLQGLRRYFEKHAFSNSQFADLLTALEDASGRELSSWAHEWLQTTGVNTLSADVATDDDGLLTRFTVRQSAAEEHPTLRRHRIGIGLYDRRDGRLVRRRSVQTDVAGDSTEVPDLLGERRPDLVLLNDGDLTYAKIRLDQRSLATLVEAIDSLDDSLARALCWGAAWDMTRDADMAASDFVTLVLRGVGAESDLTAVSALLLYARSAVELFSAPHHRGALRDRWESGLLELVDGAAAGSDHQLAFVRALAAAAHGQAALDKLAAWYAERDLPPGLVLDSDLRWTLLTGLAKHQRAGLTEIEAELARDNTISGQERAAAARAVIPTAEAKEAAWSAAVVSDETPNETQRSIARAFHVAGQDELLAPYVDRYLETAETVWEEKGVQRATTILENLFPRVLATPSVLDRVQGWLTSTAATPAAVRYVREGADDLARALRAQQRDAAA